MFRMLSVAVLTLTFAAASAHAQAPVAPPAAPRMAPVNLNTATAAQLEALPGIGKSTADRILAYREKNGPFRRPEDVMNVRGVGEKSFLKLKPLLTVGPGKVETVKAAKAPE